jgi:hypothetical protein
MYWRKICSADGSPQYNTRDNIYQDGRQLKHPGKVACEIKGGIRIKSSVTKRLGQCAAIVSPAATASRPDKAMMIN